MEKEVISIKNLQKVYSNGVQAIRGIDLTVKEQFVHALLGPNGAGKTSTIKSILGLIKFEGEIKVLGENIDKVRDRIAFVPEEKSFYDYLTPRSSVNMCKRLFENFDEKEAYRLLEYFEIPLNKKIKSFSNGMKTSVYLTLALAQDVDLYIFDEPTTGLDPIKRSNLLELLRQKMIDGKTILYSSHIIPEVEKIADYVSIMYKGKILYSGFTDEIKEKFKVIYIPVDTLSKLEINLQNFFSVMQENEVVLLLSNEEKQWEEMMEIEDAEVKDVNLEEFFNVLIRGYDNVY
jgi:ABC-2 type transport system ATP-binding protein